MTGSTTPKSWRDVLPVHPAADLFPMMSADELKALGEDIKKHGVQVPITVMHERDRRGDWSFCLYDGRNRLDAIELAGFAPISANGRSPGAAHRRREGFDCGLDLYLGIPDGEIAIEFINPPDDPFAYVASANIHRRHLSVEKKRDLIAELLKATPEKSNRQIAEIVDSSHPTVGKVRAELEATGDVEKVSTSIDTKGRKQPARKEVPARAKKHTCWQCRARAPVGEVQQHSYPAYEDVDVWLHDSCVAAFEAEEAARAAAAPDDDQAVVTVSDVTAPAQGRSWRVRARDEAGGEWSNGVRCASVAEASRYLTHHAVAILCKEATLTELCVVASGDDSNVQFERNKKGQLSGLLFEDGHCHLFGWERAPLKATS